jgi:hypothetical protein
MEVIDFFSRSCDRMLYIKIEEEEITYNTLTQHYNE